MSERDDNIEQAFHAPAIPGIPAISLTDSPMIPGDVLPDDFKIPTLEDLIAQRDIDIEAASGQDEPSDEQPGMGFGVACPRPNCLFVGTGRSLEAAMIDVANHTEISHSRTMPDNIDVAPIMSTVPLSEAPPFDPDAPDEPYVDPNSPIQL